MNRTAGLALGLLLVSSAHADGRAMEDPCLPDRWGPAGARMFHKFDPEATGQIDERRFVGHRAKRFPDLDLDGDGRITPEEYVVKYPGQTVSDVVAKYGRFDVNGDGGIDRAEWDRAEAERFHRIDVDRDGIVTREEFLADRARMCALQASPLPVDGKR